jgi:plasminogen activator inhibitor 1 RNA-binding protein
MFGAANTNRFELLFEDDVNNVPSIDKTAVKGKEIPRKEAETAKKPVDNKAKTTKPGISNTFVIILVAGKVEKVFVSNAPFPGKVNGRGGKPGRGGRPGRTVRDDRHSKTGIVDTEKKQRVWNAAPEKEGEEAVVEVAENEEVAEEKAAEPITKTLDQYLAEKTKVAVPLPQQRKANDGANDKQWKNTVVLEKKEEVFFAKAAPQKEVNRAPKPAKVKQVIPLTGYVAENKKTQDRKQPNKPVKVDFKDLNAFPSL